MKTEYLFNIPGCADGYIMSFDPKTCTMTELELEDFECALTDLQHAIMTYRRGLKKND